jgi:threonine/homoserine/homoserine lactone efflux protein
MKIFFNGLITGLLLQLAIGPVFFFILNLVLQKDLANGFVAVLAVTFVDYLYITLAIFGIGKLLEKKKFKKFFGLVSSIVLIIFGIMIIKNITNDISTISVNSTDIFASFTAAFLLTILSPMTIVFWTSVFAAKALEKNYVKHELFIFGFATGLATLLFLGTSVLLLSLFKATVPLMLIHILNFIVGGILILYGFIRLKASRG